MQPLLIKDIQDLHLAIQQLYALRDFDAFAIEARAIVNGLIPSEVPLFHVPTQRISRVEPGTDALGAPDQSSASPIELLAQDEGADSRAMGIVLNHMPCQLTERDRLLLSLLGPHLSQAYWNTYQSQQSADRLKQLQQPLNYLSLVLLDPTGHILYVTPKALGYLDDYFGSVSAIDRLPEHLWSWVKYQVNALIDNLGLAHSCLPLCIEQAGKKLVLRLVAEQPWDQYLLILEEQTLDGLKALALLGLSQRETEVLGYLLQGKSNSAIAEQLTIHPGTLRKHLEHVYKKLGVKSRTEAIALVLEKLGLLV